MHGENVGMILDKENEHWQTHKLCIELSKVAEAWDSSFQAYIRNHAIPHAPDDGLGAANKPKLIVDDFFIPPLTRITP
jgi:hypothetical protein